MIKTYQCTYVGCQQQHEIGTLCPRRGDAHGIPCEFVDVSRPRITEEDIIRVLKPIYLNEYSEVLPKYAKAIMELIIKMG